MRTILKAEESRVDKSARFITKTTGDKRMANGLVIRNSDELKAALIADQTKIFGALAGGVTQERMIGLAVRAIITTPKLLQCNPVSILDSIGQAATLGIELDGTLGQGYLIPYKEECKLVLGYRGMLDLARRHAAVKDITAEAVYAGDDFDYGLGDEPFIRHKPSDDSDREMQAVSFIYVVCNLTGGGRQRSVWSAAKINMHRDRYSKGADRKDSPWSTSWEQMGKKTVIRSMINSGAIPVAAEVQMMTGYEEYSEAGLGSPQTTVTDVPARNMSDILEGTEMPDTDATPADNKADTKEPGLLDRFANGLALCKTQEEIDGVHKQFMSFATDEIEGEQMHDMANQGRNEMANKLRQTENEQQRKEAFSLDQDGEHGE